MKVKKGAMPLTDGIRIIPFEIDFSDTFSTLNRIDSIQEIAQQIFGTMPNWVSFLMRLRNRIVKNIGLKTEKPKDYNNEYRVGGYIGFFKIYSIEVDEVILGADDKHLNFRVSVSNSNSDEFNVNVTTLVKYNNWFGKVYMTIVKPFHHFVVKRMVKQAYKK